MEHVNSGFKFQIQIPDSKFQGNEIKVEGGKTKRKQDLFCFLLQFDYSLEFGFYGHAHNLHMGEP